MSGERGSVAVELGLGVGLLLLPVAVLVLVLPTWAERQAVARVAAQEAARTAVLGGDDTGADAAAAVVARTARNYGLPPDALRVSFSGGLGRGEAFTAAVTVRVPVTIFPGIGSVGAVEWTASHTEHVDRYTSLP